MRVVLCVVLLILIFLFTACKTTPEVDETESEQVTGRTVLDAVRAHPVAQCLLLCQQAKERGQNLASGPCLSDSQSFVENWVCDVAHHPRLPVDDQPENQCRAFREGRAEHFIELDENCNFIGRR